METVLSQYPFPEIYIAAGHVNPDTGEGSEMLVDGQQRITTLYQYFTGSSDLQCRQIALYADLTQEEKIAFLEYEVVVRDLGNKTLHEIKEVFERINSSQYSLNAMEIHNARFDGALKDFVERLSQYTFFSANNVFRTNDIRRMGDLRFCLSIIICVIGGYFNREDLFEDFLTRYNDEFPEEEEVSTNLDEIFQLIERCKFDSKSRVWRKADLLTLIVELYVIGRARRQELSFKRVATGLKEFYRAVDAVRDDDDINKEAVSYYRAAVQGTNDRLNRARRGEIVAKILEVS